MSILLFRIVVFIILTLSLYFGFFMQNINPLWTLLALPFFALYLIFERLFTKSSLSSIIGGVMGLFVGVITGFAISLPFSSIIYGSVYSIFCFVVIFISASSLCLVGATKGSSLSMSSIIKSFKGIEDSKESIILDTSAIIDGRVVDVANAEFLNGLLIIPQFVIQEIQHIADSPDAIRRMRGRRAIEILKKMQNMPKLTVKITEDDFKEIKEVDSKIIALARKIGAKIVTNDYNLQKIAQLQGIKALNVNELAKMLKTVVVPGEILNIYIVKEGKELNQGVAYLEDGTMVVIENGRSFIGRALEVEVTSVLQTTAGRMIFAKPKEE